MDGNRALFWATPLFVFVFSEINLPEVKAFPESRLFLSRLVGGLFLGSSELFRF